MQFNNQECVYYPPQYEPSYQPTPNIPQLYPRPTYSPSSVYNPMAYGYQPATTYSARQQAEIGYYPLSPFDAGFYTQSPLSPLAGPLAGETVDKEIVFEWQNRPTRAGLYRFTLPVNAPISCQKRQELGILTCLPREAVKPMPFSEPVYAGAFVQHLPNGQAQLLLGEQIEQAYRDGSIQIGTGVGQVSFIDRPYIYFEEKGGGHEIQAIFAYILLTEDQIRQGLDPDTTTAFFNKKGEIVYERDAMGNEWHNPALQGSVGLVITFGAVMGISLVVASVFGILGWLGLFGTKVQKGVSTVIEAGAKKAKELASLVASGVGAFLQAAAPWLVGGTIAYLLLKSFFKL